MIKLSERVRAIELTGHPPRAADVQSAVCRRYKVSRQDLLSAVRLPAVVRPRQIAMFLTYFLGRRSFCETGRRFGGRDHTTVMHACARIDELAAIDSDLSREVRDLAEELKSACSCLHCSELALIFPFDPPQLLLPMSWPGELRLEPRIAA